MTGRDAIGHVGIHHFHPSEKQAIRSGNQSGWRFFDTNIWHPEAMYNQTFQLTGWLLTSRNCKSDVNLLKFVNLLHSGKYPGLINTDLLLTLPHA